MRILLKIPFAVEVGNEAVRLGKLAQIIQSNLVPEIGGGLLP